MTVGQLCEKNNYCIFCLCDPDREVAGGYAGDLLSWVMGRLDADHAWVTIMSNVNIVAVATLADPCCIILSEGVTPDEGVIEKARENGINVLGTAETTFSACLAIASSL